MPRKGKVINTDHVVIHDNTADESMEEYRPEEYKKRRKNTQAINEMALADYVTDVMKNRRDRNNNTNMNGFGESLRTLTPRIKHINKQ